MASPRRTGTDHRRGAIFNRGTLTLPESVIREADSQAATGGAILSLGTLTVVNSSIVNNLGSPAALASLGPLHIARSTIANNFSDTCGGIIASFGPTTIEDSTISRNVSFGIGGGLCLGGTVTIINTTIANNASDGAGGGLFVFASSTIRLRLINVTVADNIAGGFSAGSVGGGIFVDEGADEGATVQLQNTIIARNIAEALTGPDCFGSVISFGNNIIGDTADCSIDLLASDHVGDAGLGQFVDDERPGGGRIPLLPASPAIDTGNRQACPRRDQLQNRRGDGDRDHHKICDIGAIEFTTDTDLD